jgi:hypothetical protein
MSETVECSSLAELPPQLLLLCLQPLNARSVCGA